MATTLSHFDCLNAIATTESFPKPVAHSFLGQDDDYDTQHVDIVLLDQLYNSFCSSSSAYHKHSDIFWIFVSEVGGRSQLQLAAKFKTTNEDVMWKIRAPAKTANKMWQLRIDIKHASYVTPTTVRYLNVPLTNNKEIDVTNDADDLG